MTRFICAILIMRLQNKFGMESGFQNYFRLMDKIILFQLERKAYWSAGQFLYWHNRVNLVLLLGSFNFRWIPEVEYFWLNGQLDKVCKLFVVCIYRTRKNGNKLKHCLSHRRLLIPSFCPSFKCCLWEFQRNLRIILSLHYLALRSCLMEKKLFIWSAETYF